MDSLWTHFSSLPKFSRLKNDIKTDVLIIGGGIAGVLIAYQLQQQGVDYVLVEKNRICSGVTCNTTAKITYQHGLIYHKIMKSRGTEAAQKYLVANKLAFDKYTKLCQEIDCDYETKDNYVYKTDGVNELEKDMKALDKIGYRAQLCNSTALPFEISGAIKFAEQAQFNPLKFLSHIAKGLNIYENTFVREMVGNTAITDAANIIAKKVVVATHFPFINKHGSYFIKLYQHRSYVLAFENAPDVEGMYVDGNKTGISLRNYKNYLLVGGGGHRTGKNGGNWAELQKFAEKFYPNLKVTHYWATQDCITLDEIPYIGEYSARTPDLLVATGFNKWGMTGAMLSSMILCDILLGRKNDFEDVFSPSRSIIKPQLFVNAFESTANLLSFSKKRCPHLGCALKWNKVEHSWDCPCHGSRFAENGKLLDNPANGDMVK